MARLTLEVSATDKAAPVLTDVLARLSQLTKQGTAASAALAQGTQKATQGLQQSAAAAQGGVGAFGALSGAAGSLLLRMGGLVGVLGGLIAFTKSAASEADSYNEAMRRLGSALAAAGVATGGAARQTEEWVKSLQGLTRFSDTELLDAVGKAVRRVNDLAEAQRLVALTADISVATGKGFADTLDAVTLAASGNTFGVRNLKREFGELLKEVNDGGRALELLAAKFTGAAQAEDGLTKRTAQLKNDFDDLKKGVGTALLPAFSFLTESLADLVKGFNDLGQAEVETGKTKASLAKVTEKEISFMTTRANFLKRNAIPDSTKEIKLLREQVEARKSNLVVLKEQAKAEEAATAKAAAAGKKKRRVVTEEEAEINREFIKRLAERAEKRTQVDELLATQRIEFLEREGMEEQAAEERANLKLANDLRRLQELGEAAGLSFEEQQALALQTAMRSDEAFADFQNKSSFRFKALSAVGQASMAQVASNVAQGVDAMIFEGARFEEAFKGFFRSVLREATATFIQIAVRTAILTAFRTITAAGAVSAVGSGSVLGDIPTNVPIADHGLNRVPGPVGTPRIAVVHGGEKIVPFGGGNGGGTAAGGGSVVINISLHVADLNPAERARVVSALADEVRQGTDQARRFATEVSDLSARSAGRTT